MSPLLPAPWLSHLEKHVPIALEGVDPEGIHQVRVAGRRLRVLMELGGHRALVGDLRWLVRALGRTRDLDVLAEVLAVGPGTDAVAGWLAGLTEDARLEVRDVLTSARLTGLIQALRTLAPVDEEEARRSLAAFSERVRRALDTVVDSRLGGTAQVDAIHALRRALRRLRYAYDWLEEDARALKRLQEALGAMCDLTALSRLLGELSLAEGVDVSAAQRRLERAHRQMAARLLHTPAALSALR